MGGLESYRYSMKIDVATVSDDLVTNMPISVEGAYRAPDRYSAVLEVNLGFFGKLEIPVIAIGDAVYIQDPNFGEWQKVEPGEDLSYFDPDFIAFLANPAASVSPDYVGRLKNLRLGATETIDGADARAVSFTLPDGGADDRYPKLGEVDVSVWIGVADAVMRRIDAVGDLARGGDSPDGGGVLIGGGGGSGLRTDVTFRSSAALRDFDSVAEAIEPPIVGAGIEPPPFVVQSPTPAPTATPEKTTERNNPLPKEYPSAPAMSIDADKTYAATFEMEGGGSFTVKLFAAEAPRTVNNFVFLARDGYFDGVTFHRVIPGFMAQSGDPTGSGRGGPGYRFADEFHPGLRHDKPGVLSMANAGPNTNGSQFFITFVPTPHLDNRHAVFGEVSDGMETVNAISPRDPASARTPGDRIASVTITESG